MLVEILLLVLLAFGIFLARLVMLKREQRRRAALTLLLTGAAGSGLLAGLFGLDDDIGLMLSGAVGLGFGLAALLAFLMGRKPKTGSSNGSQGLLPVERHDYTDLYCRTSWFLLMQDEPEITRRPVNH